MAVGSVVEFSIRFLTVFLPSSLKATFYHSSLFLVVAIVIGRYIYRSVAINCLDWGGGRLGDRDEVSQATINVLYLFQSGLSVYLAVCTSHYYN